MTRQEFIDFAISKGRVQDRWGHFVWTRPSGRRVRYKVGKLAVRFEVKAADRWVRVRSGYYRDLSVSEDGKLRGMAS